MSDMIDTPGVRHLSDGSAYRVTTADGCIILDVRDAHEGHAVIALTPEQAVRMLADLANAMAGSAR